MSSLAPTLPANRAPVRQLPLPQLSPNTIVGVTLGACIAVGLLMAYDFKLGIGLLVGLCYLPLVLVNLPLGIALWVPTTFLTGLPGFDTASHAAGLVIALAWFGTLRSHAIEQNRHVPRGLLLLVAVFVIWLALSMLWAEKPEHVVLGAPALGGLRADVHRAHDARPERVADPHARATRSSSGSRSRWPSG